MQGKAFFSTWPMAEGTKLHATSDVAIEKLQPCIVLCVFSMTEKIVTTKNISENPAKMKGRNRIESQRSHPIGVIKRKVINQILT